MGQGGDAFSHRHISDGAALHRPSQGLATVLVPASVPASMRSRGSLGSVVAAPDCRDGDSQRAEYLGGPGRGAGTPVPQEVLSEGQALFQSLILQG